MSAAQHPKAPPVRADSSIGTRMRMVRASANMRQDEMAATLGVSRQTLVQYERDNCTPPYRVLRNACKEFGIDGSWLLLGGPASTMFRSAPKGAL
jgi:DNA-binding XRE family transcriptional regulator